MVYNWFHLLGSLFCCHGVTKTLGTVLQVTKEYSSEMLPWGWRDGSVIGSTGCSEGGSGFGSYHPHGSLQLAVIPVSTNPVLSSGLCGHLCMQAVHMHTCGQNTHTHKTIKNKHFG